VDGGERDPLRASCGKEQDKETPQWQVVYHFMFGPDYTAGCPSCSAIADGFNGFAVHLANHDVMLCTVSRAPLKNIQAYQRRMGWSFPWAATSAIDFNLGFPGFIHP
jgi:predicted dithiol-disulfide oxidoreductase (DUF899 family)